MSFSQEIINWYHPNKRDLPWRHTTDPYIIWLSEIILQQTRVEQGLPYFYRFVEQYPNIATFAAAEEGEILRLWQGLGYYSRARNMHKAAKMVMDNHDGIFPTTYDSLIKLNGIGGYTAAAIASFSANEAKPVLDGNVFRVLSRYFGIEEAINTPKGKKLFYELALEMLDKEQPAIYNQSIMEFGALQCKPQNPDCQICPLRTSCYAKQTNKVNSLPVKIKGRISKDRYFYYFVIMDEKSGSIAIRKRGPKDIWENMYEFPLIEQAAPLSISELKNTKEFNELFGRGAELHIISTPKKHILSHQNIYATFLEVSKISKDSNKKGEWDYVLLKDLDTLAKPKLIFAFLRDYNLQ
ncbi:A/G-specific adenine glycosylase [Olivibacter domesticus]|uniref:Adenine DNA glycosylase n=1 Tax=Olivibacter domesticus TaxID=407022 RepID=A0A1H7SMM3_OLID1|nr:A/G-specific adenine glycosylase [Olivibacter domesticus]SEL73891.1 A/G-specific DNA-adenine glycosylase [Olivibacter domesticus]